MAAALARASFAGAAAARLSLAEMMGLCRGRVAPRGLGSRRRPGLHARLRGRPRTKNPSSLCVDHQLYGEIAASTRVINLLIRGNAASRAH